MQKQIHRTILIIAIATLAIAATGIAQQTPEKTVPSPKELLNKMARAYSSCKSYKDKGVVTAVAFRDKEKITVPKIAFTTAFIRPDKFRFEFQDNRGVRHIIWQDGESVCKWTSIGTGIEKIESLSRAIAGATGVSLGSGHNIPCLLLPEKVGGYNLTSLTDLELLDDEVLDSVPCFKIQGKNKSGQVETHWLEKKSYLVRKMFKTSKNPDYRIEITTTYAPQLNVDVRPDDLKLNTPEEAKQPPSPADKLAPTFTLQDLNGKQVSLSDFKGKVVLLDFWATWCAPCRRTIPHLEALHKKYKDQGLVVIGINNETDHDKVKAFAKERISYIILLDANKQFQEYGIRGIPTAFYIDRAGKIDYSEIGYTPGSEKKAEQKVKELLAVKKEETAEPK